jgi:hypothetical protein
MNIFAVRQFVGATFPNLWLPTEALLATTLAMVPDDVVNPPTCIFTGSPSSQKTTILDFIMGIEDVTYRSDKFTPRAFVSHAANVARDRLGEIDLLPRIRHKVLATPELAPTFRQREDALSESFAILTAVLDGHGYISDSGTQGRRGYTGDYLFSWVGATTPLPPDVWRVMAQLGSRLLFYAMPDREVTDDELDEALMGTSYRNRVDACQLIVGDFLRDRLQHYGGVRGIQWDCAQDSKPVIDALKHLARLLARLRSFVPRENLALKDCIIEDPHYQPPDTEQPYRALACLYNLARGRALLYNRTKLSQTDLLLVTHTALSSIPHDRSKLIRALIGNGGTLTTRQAARAMAVSLPTARARMLDMNLLGIGTMTGGEYEGWTLTLRPQWHWCLRLPIGPIYTGTGPFQGGENEGKVCVPTVHTEAAIAEVDPWKD